MERVIWNHSGFDSGVRAVATKVPNGYRVEMNCSGRGFVTTTPHLRTAFRKGLWFMLNGIGSMPRGWPT